MSSEAKQAMLDKHNELRRRVAKGEETGGMNGPQPGASNMKKLVWSAELESVAQRWADQCTVKTDCEKSDLTFLLSSLVTTRSGASWAGQRRVRMPGWDPPASRRISALWGDRAKLPRAGMKR